MKIIRIVMVLCLSVFSVLLYANDTLIQKSVGGNEYIIGKSNTITIETEILKIDLYKDYYTVSVDYIFRNDGETVTLDVGFPEIEYQIVTENINDSQKIRNFSTSIDGVNQDVKIQTADIMLDYHVDEKIKKFYAKKVNFPENKKTEIHVEYVTSYNMNTRGMGVYFAEYLLGSAICWKKIENLKVFISINCEDYFLIREFDDIESNKPNYVKVSTENNNRLLELNYTNINLKLDTRLKIIIDNENGIFGLPWDYNFECKLYPKSDFELLTKDQLRLSRNLIYAYHGYEFENKELMSIYEEYGFYKINRNFSETEFNNFERKNLELIISVENNK